MTLIVIDILHSLIIGQIMVSNGPPPRYEERLSFLGGRRDGGGKKIAAD